MTIARESRTCGKSDRTSGMLPVCLVLDGAIDIGRVLLTSIASVAGIAFAWAAAGLGHHIRKSLIEEAEKGLVRHPEDLAGGVALLSRPRARDAHLLQLEGGPRNQPGGELVVHSVVAHCASVLGGTLLVRLTALPVRAGYLDLLADLLHRLLIKEREDVLRYRLLPLALLALRRHEKRVSAAQTLRFWRRKETQIRYTGLRLADEQILAQSRC